MKKFYLSALSLLFASSLTAQVTIDNPSFENWTSGDANGFTVAAGIPVPSSANIYSNFGTLSTTPLVEETTGASVGTSYARLTSFTLSGSTNPNIPDGDYASNLLQEIPSTERPSEFTFDYKSNFGGNNDSAVVLVEATKWNGSSRDIISQSFETYSTDEASWVNATIPVTYLQPGNPDTISVYISASIGGVFNSVGGNPVAAPVAGSQFDVDNLSFTVPNYVPDATNVVASDISDNGNGTDLDVTFDAAAPETNVANYYALVVKSGDEGLVGQVGLPVIQAYGTQIAASGSASYSTVFSAPKDSALFINNGNLDTELIKENEPYKVVIYVEAAGGGFTDSYNGVSNEQTLTSGPSSISENWEDNMNVYPNPVRENLTFDFANANEVSKINIININGARVKEVGVNGNALINVNVSNLAKGFYMYQIIDQNGKAAVVNKFVKK